MQRGKIKHWNASKGYGFIEVDNQSEEVFFHITKARLTQPILVGQPVYFTSERSGKNELRAIEVTATELSLQDSPKSNISSYKPSLTTPNRPKNMRSKQHKGSPFAKLLSLIAIIALAVYFFGDIKSSSIGDDEYLAQTATSFSEAGDSSATAITGDPQIDHTIALIQQGGPFPYPDKDGTTFYNREGRLPAQSSGYYREYTVPTPSVSDRGARRIVTGGNPPTVYYLTVDHYDSFSPLQVN